MPDLILLHAPSVYDFRKKTILYGPVSDLIPSTTAFEMYPIGFASMVDYLTRAGYSVRILNLAVRMLNNKNFDVEAAIKKLEVTALRYRPSLAITLSRRYRNCQTGEKIPS